MKRALACILAVLLLLLPLTACAGGENESAPGTPGDSAWPANVPMPLEELTWGMSPEEVERMKESSCQPVTLGPRILRTETAGLCAISALLCLYGDME